MKDLLARRGWRLCLLLLLLLFLSGIVPNLHSLRRTAAEARQPEASAAAEPTGIPASPPETAVPDEWVQSVPPQAGPAAFVLHRFPSFEVLERRVAEETGGLEREIVLCRDPRDPVFPLKRVETLARRSGDSIQILRSVAMLGDRFACEAAADGEKVASALEGAGLSFEPSLPFSPVTRLRLAETSLDRFDAARATLNALAAAGFLRASNDYVAQIANLPNDPEYEARQGDLALIGAPAGWSIATGSADTVVAVIDSGIDLSHPDLAPNLFVNAGEIAANGIDDDENGLIDDMSGWDFHAGDAFPDDVIGHGTAMSGIVAAVGDNGIGIAGTSWDSRLLPLKAGNDLLPWSAIAQAIDYVVWLKQQGAPVAAINNSYAGEIDDEAELDVLYQAIGRAREADLLFVAAAGNGATGGRDNDVTVNGLSQHVYPSDYDHDNVLSVAATDLSDVLAPTSNYGAVSVDMAAPGVSIFTTTKGGAYGTVSGTSCSSARVSGAAALLRSVNPNFDYLQLKSLLINNGQVAIDLLGRLANPVRLDLGTAPAEARLYPQIEWKGESGPLFVREGESALLEANASDFDGQVARVEWWADDVLLAVDTNGADGWEFVWRPESGETRLKLRVFDFDEKFVTRSSRTARIMHRFDYWRYGVWGPRFDALSAARPEADPDMDGLSNLFEYAIMGSPLVASSAVERTGWPEAKFIRAEHDIRLEIALRINDLDTNLEVNVMQANRESGFEWIQATPDSIEAVTDPEVEGASRLTFRFGSPTENFLYRLGLSRSP